jgi:hypothetical protein
VQSTTENTLKEALCQKSATEGRAFSILDYQINPMFTDTHHDRQSQEIRRCFCLPTEIQFGVHS